MQRSGGPHTIAVAILDKQTIIVRNHDAPHFATAFEAMSALVSRSITGGAAEVLCNGVAAIDAGETWGRGYVRPPAVLTARDRVTYATREVSDAPMKLLLSPDGELEPMPEFTPPRELPLRLRGRHRVGHFLEFDLLTRSPRDLDDATRSFLANLARMVPGNLVMPLTHLRIVLAETTEMADEIRYEGMLRHPHVWLRVRTGRKRELRQVTAPSVQAVADNLSRPLSVLVAEGYA